MKFLQEALTEDGTLVDVWIANTLNSTPVFSMVLSSFAELIDKKWAMSSADIFKFGEEERNPTKVIWAQDKNGTPLGGIYYRLNNDLNCLEMLLSFTGAEFRGKGVNHVCYQSLENDCKKEGFSDIIGAIHVDNKSSLRASIEKIGLKPLFVVCHKKIKKNS